jgi:hypothetical protein|tara:strand:- start:203 stop:685 length:483 start_codon:yes stop_codon:yes gene_type:complete
MTDWQDISHKELSSWATVFIVGSMLIYYVAELFALDAKGLLTTSSHNQLIFLVVIACVVVEIVLQVAIAISKRVEAQGKTDERDKEFERTASYYSNFLISTFVVLLILAVSQSDWLVSSLSGIWHVLTHKDILLFTLIIGFGITQVFHHLLIAIMYRKGS